MHSKDIRYQLYYLELRDLNITFPSSKSVKKFIIVIATLMMIHINNRWLLQKLRELILQHIFMLLLCWIM